MSRILLLVWCGVLALRPSALGEMPGIYADFNTTLGNFSCQLEFNKAPKAVANFIGLATGQKTWIDESTGFPRTVPFYDGLTFHRVIAGFMIQGGSPNGQGNDGPGYAFPDEFDPTLRHDGPGVLSSANSGPNSNGAQFFVTVAATPWLNDAHTIFGRVVSGQEVVDAINQVPTGEGDKPVTPVRVTGLAIRRVGAAAEAFDIHAQGLPVVSMGSLGITATAAQATLSFSNLQHAAHRIISTTNLVSWTETDLGITLAPSAPGSVTAMAEGKRFFAMTRVQYPSSTFAPVSLRRRTLALAVDGSGVLTIQFDDAGGGSYTFPPFNPGTVTDYTWTQDPYRGHLWPIFYSGGLVPMTLRLDFSSETGGDFSGTAHATTPFPVAGSFTLSGP